MLNRFLNLARRHKDPADGAEDLTAFPPRKRAIGTTCFGQADAEDTHAPSVGTAQAPPEAQAEVAGPPQHAASPEPSAPEPSAMAQGEEPVAPAAPAASTATPEEPDLALEQTRLSIEDGLLMVLGPEGDPVPPHAFGAAAALRPDTALALPDGTTATAAKVAAALGAQLLGRLGAGEDGAGWILAMLRDGGGPAAATDEALRADDEALGAEQSWTGDDAPPPPEDAEPAAHATPDETWPDETWPEPATPCLEPGGETAARGALDLDEPIAVSDADLDLDLSNEAAVAPFVAEQPAADSSVGEPLVSSEPFGSDEAFAPDPLFHPDDPVPSDYPFQPDAPERLDEAFAPEQPLQSAEPPCSAEPVRADEPIGFGPPDPAPPAEAREADINPDSMVLVVMRGVPEDASLSSGIRDDDGSWSISPIDLPTVTIRLAGQEGTGEARRGDRDLSITGIAFGEDGELVAISETVPLADYLAAPAPGDPAGERPEDSAPPSAPPSPPERVVPLAVEPEAMAGESFDALVIRDLPAGARLSAGAYDPAIAGWVLRPQDLSALALVAPPDLRGDFRLTLMGVALRPGSASVARALGGLSVTLA
jgi:hypothetical protein